MPGNTIIINGVLQWHVGDSKMEELVSWLDEKGVRTEKNEKQLVGNTDRFKKKEV